MNDLNAAASLVGLIVAFGGTVLLVSPVSRLLGDPDRLATKLREQVVLWVLFAVLLAIVLLWEKQPLASMWLRPLHWRSLAWGVLLAALGIYVVFPVRMWLLRVSGLPGFGAGVEKILAFPVWFRVVAVITAGIVEETLFHGYALTRLGMLIGSYWWAAMLVVPAFALVHLPMWGAGPVLTFVVSGAVSAAVFIWLQDLLAMAVAHTIVDAMGLVVMPSFSRWWEAKTP